MLFTIKERGLDLTIAALATYRGRFRDYNDFLVREIEPELKDQFTKCFNTKGFGKWAQLDADTIEAKSKGGRVVTPLIDTGRYRRACENLKGKTLGKNSIKIVSPISYAIFHEFGTKDIPPRPVFELVANRMRRKVRKLYREYNRRQTRGL